MATIRARSSASVASEIDRAAKQYRSLTRGVLQKSINNFKRRMLRERLSGRPGLNKKTGRTAQSLEAKLRVLKTTFRISAKIGNRSTPGVGIHETGGTIRPKRKPWLAIPLSTGAGRKVDFWITNKKGNIVGMAKAGNAIIPVVVLVKSVTIPARLQFARTFRIEMNKMKRELRKEIRILNIGKNIAKVSRF